MKLRPISRTLQVLALGTVSCAWLTAAETWTPLFDGKSIDGWISRGGKAKYTVEEGAIVGTSTLKTENTFLCPPKEYGDFILEYEFKVDPKLNSGVQIRSQAFPEPRTIEWQGKSIKVPANRVHGYQIEIDPEPAKKRWWSGGIYEEGARGWLYPGALGGEAKAFTEQGEKTFKQEAWNHVRVEAKGDSLKTFLNGTPRAAIQDARVASGFIGLQVHGIGNDQAKDGTQVRWRNLRIQELTATKESTNMITTEEQAAGWKLLWDGTSTKGWRSAKSPEFPKKGWLMENGILTIQEADGGESSAFGDIITVDKFSDFELKVDFKITPGANSGIKIFVDPDLNQGKGSSIGPEFQILDDAKHPDAKLGSNGNRTMGSLYDLIPAPKDKNVNPPGEWNHAHIISKGSHVEFRLNGVKTVEFDRSTPAWRDLVKGSKYKIWPGFGELKEGHILLQDHGNRVSYKNIKIRTSN